MCCVTVDAFVDGLSLGEVERDGARPYDDARQLVALAREHPHLLSLVVVEDEGLTFDHAARGELRTEVRGPNEGVLGLPRPRPDLALDGLDDEGVAAAGRQPRCRHRALVGLQPPARVRRGGLS